MAEAANSDLIPVDNCDINTKTKWLSGFIGSCSRYFGYVHTVEEAMAVMKQYKLDTTTRLSCFKSSKDFGSRGEHLVQHVYIEFTGSDSMSNHSDNGKIIRASILSSQ
ncbi:Hypothetical predicted protein [Paramuricea clavata]|uniref:Uncharacterized protein n=1 Tax=Paramuricea clavata TaxID=317549 RepID=A0A6S7FT40_PARCT|nr:Hypothetical predicted protein [Paramuricea clavata]